MSDCYIVNFFGVNKLIELKMIHLENVKNSWIAAFLIESFIF